ncbi:MAG: divalent-cation tolerance protein CutA [Verrucomicrobia bacterium]|nr:divalent-cation tolerance protein CutA [Verrucomicrobiota bacterium]
MKATTQFAVVLVTAPDLKTARRLARSALRARLVACANLVSRIESHYWWRGKLESSAEVLIVFKTARARLAALEKRVLAAHPYDTPEFVVLPVRSGAAKYLKWLGESVRG